MGAGFYTAPKREKSDKKVSDKTKKPIDKKLPMV